MDPQDIVSLALGIWGAGLSTALAVWHFRQDRRHVKVTCDIVTKNIAPLAENPVYAETLEITAINTGHRPVEITRAALCLSDGQLIDQPSKLYFQRLPLPGRLDDAESTSIYMDVERIEEDLCELRTRNPKLHLTRAIIGDAEGNTYKARLPPYFKSKGLA